MDLRRGSAPGDGEINADTKNQIEKKSESNQHLYVKNTNYIYLMATRKSIKNFHLLAP